MDRSLAKSDGQIENISVLHWFHGKFFFFISELSKVIQERILWIHVYRTIYCHWQLPWVHLSCRMLLQYALYHRIRIDSGRQKRKPGSTNGILWSRKPFSHALSRARSRSDKAPICYLQATNWEYTKMQCIGLMLGLLRKRDWSFSKRDHTQSFSTTRSNQSVLKHGVHKDARSQIHQN